MHPRMLQYYEQELAYFREMGAEFAQQFPKIAARLALDSTEVADPYVERLLEGVSFLAARVRLKLDAEFPRFTQHLLEAVYPHYLAPTPSMVIAQYLPSLTEAGLADGFLIPRGTLLRSTVALRNAITRDDETECQFRTGHDVILWSIEISGATYSPFAPDLPLARLPIAETVRGVLRLRLRATASLTWSQLALDRLRLFLTGDDAVALRLYDLLVAGGLGVMVAPPGRPLPWFEWLPSAAIQPAGFAPDEALLPGSVRSFDGYRLLQEYFAFPERFRFVELAGLRRALGRHGGDEIELAIPLARGDAALPSLVGKDNFALHCTPAVNLFRRPADRIHVSEQHFEHHVVVDRTRPMDFEVYRVESVTGYGEGVDAQQVFRPFYATADADGQTGAHGYFTVRREPRLLSEAQRRDGARTDYIGSEVFLSLVDAREAPYSVELRQLAVEALVTNRDLPLLMRLGTDRDFTMAAAAPYQGIRGLRGPSRPRPVFPDGEVAWRLVNHLAFNYLTLSDVGDEQGAAALRELLELYTVTGEGGGGASVMQRQVAGVRRISIAPRIRRSPAPGPIVFARGLEIRLTVDERAFAGSSALLLGGVLEQFFARIVSMNTFTEFVLLSEGQGEIKRWPPRIARRQLV
jgi:type VI secretion system protein ImpG